MGILGRGKAAGAPESSESMGKRQSLVKRWLIASAAAIAFLLCIAIPALAIVAWRIELMLGNGKYVCIIFALLLLAVTAVSIVINFLFVKSVQKPIEKLINASRSIAEGSYGTHVQKTRDDEIGDLIDSINEMSTQIAQSEKLQSEFISSVSHELRTPLTAITGWSETLAYDEAICGDSRRGVAIISKEAGRLTKMVGELLEFTRIQDGRFNLDIQSVDVSQPLEDCALSYSEVFKKSEIELCYEPYDGDFPMVAADPERLKQVFLNLLDNAAKHGAAGGKVLVKSEVDGAKIIISVRDYGKGIEEADLPHLKEKFFKGSSRERGSGIGLAICEEIISRHKGSLEITNAEGGGALARVTLPAGD